VPGQSHLLGDLAEAGLDPVAPLGDDLQHDGGCGGVLVPGGRDEDRGAGGSLDGGKCPTGKALIAQQVTGRRSGLEQAVGDLALVYRGGHGAPGPDDPRAEVARLAELDTRNVKAICADARAFPLTGSKAADLGADAFLPVAGSIWKRGHNQIGILLVSASHASHGTPEQAV
jgi:hypothetical protein